MQTHINKRRYDSVDTNSYVQRLMWTMTHVDKRRKTWIYTHLNKTRKTENLLTNKYVDINVNS